jgi:hypothetical protein
MDADSITVDWLSEMIGVAVSHFSVTFLEGGVVSDVFRIHDVRYSGPSGEAATSFVVKLATQSDDRRQMALACGLYLKELNFYRVLAPPTPIRSPRTYACVEAGKASPERFAILMQDLSVHSKVFDQVHDPPDEQFARELAIEAARLHAYYWESDVTRLPWLGRGDGRYVFSLDPLSRSSPANLPVFSSLWRKMYKEDLFDEDRFGEATRLTQLLCGPLCDLILDRIYDILSSRPKTLLHGDMRADNVFRSDSRSGRQSKRSQLTFIDWQLMHVGQPGPESSPKRGWAPWSPTCATGSHPSTEYRDTLVNLNPLAEPYTYEMLIEDYSWLLLLADHAHYGRRRHAAVFRPA